MGRQIEERISKVVNAGPDAVQNHIAAGHGLEMFVCLGLIFLKTHLKDRDIRINPDLRKPADKIGDLYDWQSLRHMHCLVRCFVRRAHLEKEVFGSLAAFAAKSEGWLAPFDYGDVYDAQTMLLRISDVALVTSFNDACGALPGGGAQAQEDRRAVIGGPSAGGDGRFRLHEFELEGASEILH